MTGVPSVVPSLPAWPVSRRGLSVRVSRPINPTTKEDDDVKKFIVLGYNLGPCDLEDPFLACTVHAKDAADALYRVLDDSELATSLAQFEQTRAEFPGLSSFTDEDETCVFVMDVEALKQL